MSNRSSLCARSSSQTIRLRMPCAGLVGSLLLASSALAEPAEPAAPAPAASEASAAAPGPVAADPNNAASGESAAEPSAGPFPIDEGNPEISVPSLEQRQADPIRTAMFMLNISGIADDAMDDKDYPRAIKYYRAFVKGAPDHAAGFSKLCMAYELNGEWASARAACSQALSRPGVMTSDYVRTLRLALVDPKEQLAPEVVADLDAIIAHLEAEKIKEPFVYYFPCDLALRLNDPARLRSCIEKLPSREAEETRAGVYKWSLALMSQDFHAARDQIESLRVSGDLTLTPAKLAEMESETQRAEQLVERKAFSRWALVGAVLIACGLVAMGVIRLLRRRQRPAITG